MASIFISHAHSDKALIDALKALFENVYGETSIQINYSSAVQPGQGIPYGEDWFKWILENVKNNDITLVIVTPGSVNKPWLLWEAGAVQGVALANNKASKIIPILYSLSSRQIPPPFKNIQIVDGQNKNAIKKLLSDLMKPLFNDKPNEKIYPRLMDAETAINDYIKKIEEILIHLPLPITETAIWEWYQRIEDLVTEGRNSEITVIERWLKIAFGFEGSNDDYFIDMRIHRILGEAFLSARLYEKAIMHFLLASQNSPRDIFILRKLGQAYLDSQQLEKASEIIEKITILDKNAFSENSECAGIKGRFFKEKYKQSGNSNDLKLAREVYEKALEVNDQSYYLANNIAMLSLQLAEEEKAKSAFSIVINILDRLNEQSIWSLSTRFNAKLFFQEFNEIKDDYIKRIYALKPDSNEIISIASGIKIITNYFKIKAIAIPEPLISDLNCYFLKYL